MSKCHVLLSFTGTLEQDHAPFVESQKTNVSFKTPCNNTNGSVSSSLVLRMNYPTMSFTYPQRTAPTKENETYNTKTRRATRDRTAAIAGKVVVGPAIKNALVYSILYPRERSTESQI